MRFLEMRDVHHTFRGYDEHCNMPSGHILNVKDAGDVPVAKPPKEAVSSHVGSLHVIMLAISDMHSSRIRSVDQLVDLPAHFIIAYEITVWYLRSCVNCNAAAQ